MSVFRSSSDAKIYFGDHTIGEDYGSTLLGRLVQIGTILQADAMLEFGDELKR